MPKQLLNRPQIRTAFKQMRGETVPQCMNCHPFGYHGPVCRFFYVFLQGGGVDVVTPDDMGPWIDG